MPSWHVYETIPSSAMQNGELSFPNGCNSISLYFFSQNPKCRFILFQYTNVFLCAKFGDLKPTIDEKRRPQIWTCFWARRRNKKLQRNCNFISTKCFKMLIDHHDQQTVLRKTEVSRPYRTRYFDYQYVWDNLKWFWYDSNDLCLKCIKMFVIQKNVSNAFWSWKLQGI